MIIVEIKDDHFNYRLSAHVNAAGDLTVSGHDLSKGLEELLGTDEYEYWYIVRAAHVPRVCAALRTTNAALLEAIKALCAPHDINASTEWKKWLVANRIPYEFSTWR